MGSGSLSVTALKVPKPTDDDKARFRSLVPDDPRVEVKAMFGNLGAFVNGSMSMGLMGGYTTLPASLTVPMTRSFTQKALDNAATLPPKATKK
jgi:hypothetical protein